MTIKPKFQIGEMVYVQHDPYQYLRQVTSIIIRPDGLVYECSLAEMTETFYDFELDMDKNLTISLGVTIDKGEVE